MRFTAEMGWCVAFLLLSLFFYGMEAAFMASDKMQYALNKKSSGGYRYILDTLYGHPRPFLTTLIIGKTSALVLFIRYALSIAEASSFEANPNMATLLGVIVILTLILLLTVECIPRFLYGRRANSRVRILALPAFLFYILLYPISKLLFAVSKGILRLFGIRFAKPEQPAFSRADLDTYVKRSIHDLSKEREVDSEVKIFRNALDFSTLKIKECMVPRAEITAVEIHTDITSLKEKFIETGFSRLPVFKEHIDNIVGYIHIWELFNAPEEWTKKIASISFVPESMPASRLMSDLMQQRKSIAIVVDEFGGTSGMITMEDLVEEIFGEIEDEYDVKSKFIKQEKENQYVLSGRVEIDTLNEMYHLDIPESDDYTTIAGILLHVTQRFPKTYETIVIGRYTFKILKVTARKIEVVQLTIQKEEDA